MGKINVIKYLYNAISSIERLHRQFLDLLKIELERGGIHDINNVQSLILYNIGHDELTVGELTIRGYYLGSNVSYNVKKMVENDYLVQTRSIHDKRSVRVKLSDKGHKLCSSITKLYEAHETKLADSGISDEKLTNMNKLLEDLEQFWTTQSGKFGLSVED